MTVHGSFPNTTAHLPTADYMPHLSLGSRGAFGRASRAGTGPRDSSPRAVVGLSHATRDFPCSCVSSDFQRVSFGARWGLLRQQPRLWRGRRPRRCGCGPRCLVLQRRHGRLRRPPAGPRAEVRELQRARVYLRRQQLHDTHQRLSRHTLPVRSLSRELSRLCARTRLHDEPRLLGGVPARPEGCARLRGKRYALCQRQ